MKVYQIVMKGDERSEKYAELSKLSFQNLIDDGTLDWNVFDAITPEHPDFEEHVAKYDWRPSLARLDAGKQPQDHSPTEKAGMCSHWELMRQQGATGERFLVMEHDTYLWPQHENEFRNLLTYIHAKNIIYANIGLFMGCYTFKPFCAAWQYRLLTEQKFWINCGPYGVLERLFKNYVDHFLSKQDENLIPENYIIHPWANGDTLYFGRDIHLPYNHRDPDPMQSVKNPTTQMVSKSLAVTQDHHGYPDIHIEQPWTRSDQFKVIP